MTGTAADGWAPFDEVLAAIVVALPDDHLDAWARVLAGARGPDSLVEAALIDARPGYAVAGHARRLVAAWRDQSPVPPGAAIALALRTAARFHRRAVARRTGLVVSGPVSPSVPVRLTSSVVIEVIRSARRSVLVVSFAAYGVAEVVAELAAAADRGVRTDLVLESSVDGGGALRGRGDASAAFAALRDRATFWHWPAGRRSADGARAALHAKLVAADSQAALVGSANLTDRAMSDNLEVGILLRDPDVVRRLVSHFTALMDTRTGPLEPLS
jgi:phosphatidylserine/phosphatidylglycerophosphate/cardiolipin synthase-like enzyme